MLFPFSLPFSLYLFYQAENIWMLLCHWLKSNVNTKALKKMNYIHNSEFTFAIVQLKIMIYIWATHKLSSSKMLFTSTQTFTMKYKWKITFHLLKEALKTALTYNIAISKFKNLQLDLWMPVNKFVIWCDRKHFHRISKSIFTLFSVFI